MINTYQSPELYLCFVFRAIELANYLLQYNHLKKKLSSPHAVIGSESLVYQSLLLPSKVRKLGASAIQYCLMMHFVRAAKKLAMRKWQFHTEFMIRIRIEFPNSRPKIAGLTVPGTTVLRLFAADGEKKKKKIFDVEATSLTLF